MKKNGKLEEKIIYQSQSIPDFVITEPQYKLLQMRFPGVKSFQRYVFDAEAWMLDPANKAKLPKMKFRFLYNWIAKEMLKAQPGAPAPKEGDASLSLGGARKPSNAYPFEKKKDHLIDNVHALDRILEKIKQQNNDINQEGE